MRRLITAFQRNRRALRFPRLDGSGPGDNHRQGPTQRPGSLYRSGGVAVTFLLIRSIIGCGEWRVDLLRPSLRHWACVERAEVRLTRHRNLGGTYGNWSAYPAHG